MIQLKKILLESAPTDKEYTYKYPKDTTYVYAYKDGKWWAKNISTGKTFDLSVDYEKYKGSIDKLNQYFNKTDKDLEQDTKMPAGDKLFRMENGFLINTTAYESIKASFKMGDFVSSPALKALTYDKSYKIRTGVQDGVFRGYDAVTANQINKSDGSINSGFISNNESDYKVVDAKIGITIPDQIKGNKIYVANNWKQSVNKKPIIYTYFYIKSSGKFEGKPKYYWLPGNYISVV